MKTIHLVMAVAASLVLMGTAQAGTPHDDVSCRRADVLVALAEGQPVSYAVTGELCATRAELYDGAAVQLLVHGATYSHEYWDFGEIDGASYSYARAVAARGTATFAFDQIGTGGSSHPASALVTVAAAAHVEHTIVRALRNGSIHGTRFGKVIAVGHALGSVVVWSEAIRYADVDGVIVTAVAHALSARYTQALPAVYYPAVSDPRFTTTGLDHGYLTTAPGARAGLFFAAFIAEEEAHKDVVPVTELITALPMLTSTATRAIQVPVLTIVGGNDATTCGPGTQGGTFDCSSASAVVRQEAPFYSRQARLHACVIPAAGHDLNLTLNHGLQVADAVAWSKAFVERRPGGRHDAAPSANDGLPQNCGGVSPELSRTGSRIDHQDVISRNPSRIPD